MKHEVLLIDEEEFAIAANSLNELSQEIAALDRDIREMLDDLKAGFDTPAGRKFLQSCSDNLCTPLIQQAIVVNHLADNLMTARNIYAPVFDEYRSIVNKFNQ